jgi:hypothetical protein
MAQCATFDAETLGRPSLPPGICFRLLLIGYFEGIEKRNVLTDRARRLQSAATGGLARRASIGSGTSGSLGIDGYSNRSEATTNAPARSRNQMPLRYSHCVRRASQTTTATMRVKSVSFGVAVSYRLIEPSLRLQRVRTW